MKGVEGGLSSPALISILPAEGYPFFWLSTACHGRARGNKTASEQILRNTRSALERALKLALSGGQYDDGSSQLLLNYLQWRDLSILLDPPPPYVTPPYIKYTLTEDTVWVIPELVPARQKWLDTLCPSYRTFDQTRMEESDRRPPTVALIYMENDRELPFGEWANDAAQRLAAKGIQVDLYPGGELAERSSSFYKRLGAIFHEHRAVLFYGHLIPDEEGKGGWALTPDVPLTMRELGGVLAPGIEQGRQKKHPVPEVVFAGCCGGAGQDPKRFGWRGLSYPRVFLEAGVRFFIGAWMDVVGEEPGALGEDIVGLSTDFLASWKEKPDHAVYHLYDAKKARDFPLVGSLFHIYCPDTYVPPPRDEVPSAESPNVVHQETAKPHGGFIAAVENESHVGKYELGRRLWSTPFSITFWATSAAGNHMVEILSDAWQGSAAIAQQIEKAIEPLQRAGLGNGHLIPTRTEVCELGEEEPRQRLLALIYDRPAGESAESWSQWEEDGRRRAGGGPAGEAACAPYADVLELGSELASLVAELHDNNLRHGNLAPANLVHCRAGGQRKIVLKDAWLWAHRPNQRVDPRFTPPEERLAPPNAGEVKGDCWALGAILYTAATGQPPEIRADESQTIPSIREVLRQDGALVPDALEQVVRECLIPSPVLRPRAGDVAFRLSIGSAFGHEYRNDFEARLFRGLRAGERLFGIPLEDRRELDPILSALEHRGHPVFVFEPELGVVQRAAGRVVWPWNSAQVLESFLTPAGGRPVRRLLANEVLALNAVILLKLAIDQLRHVTGPVPVVVVYGGFLWNAAAAEQRIAMRRLLRNCEYEYGAPAVIFADPAVLIHSDPELEEAFHWLRFPPLSPADLFDRIVSAPQAERLDVPPVTVEQAMSVAGRLHPIHGRELSHVLRLAALQYGCIDDRAAAVLDVGREEAFRRADGVTYIPLARLPVEEEVGLPVEVRKKARQWAELVEAASDAAVKPPAVVMIEGPSGYGKTTTALLLGNLTNRPVIRIDVGACFGRNLGQSETTLRAALQFAVTIPGVLVLLDDIDHFVAQSQSADHTMRRMDGIFLHWLDDLPPYAGAVLTATRGDRLPGQWQRRVELRLPLDQPVGLAAGPASNAYRADVFRAVFRKSGLPFEEGDPLLLELADRTNPGRIPALPLHSPLALVEGGSALQALRVTLDSAAAIEQWVQDVLLFHGAAGDPTTSAFWIDKLRQVDGSRLTVPGSPSPSTVNRQL